MRGGATADAACVQPGQVVRTNVELRVVVLWDTRRTTRLVDSPVRAVMGWQRALIMRYDPAL